MLDYRGCIRVKCKSYLNLSYNFTFVRVYTLILLCDMMPMQHEARERSTVNNSYRSVVAFEVDSHSRGSIMLDTLSARPLSADN